MRKIICFTLLFMFISLSRSKICQVRTASNITKDVCCADYEKGENECIACSKGYTSYMGQNCKPCMKSTYGERCRYDCSCLAFEVCDNVEGCVNYSSTTGISVYATSSTSVQRSGGKTCGVNTKWGTIKVCCADFEEKGKGCIACSRGYTSMMGQKCRPCQNNTYGERCKYECSCSRFERCDLASGCVLIQPITDTSEYVTTHDITSQWTGITGTDSEIDSTTLDERTNGKNRVDNFEDLLSRKIVTYYTITLMVVVPGLCLCMVFYKQKLVTKKKKPAIIHPKIHSISNNSQIIGMEESLYDNIDETDILGLIERIEIPPHNILIGGSNNTVNGEDTPCFNEGQYATKQDHPVIKISPPTIKDYIAEAIVHRIDSGLSDNDGRTLRENGNALVKDIICLSYPYDIPSVSNRSTVPKRCFSNETGRLSKSCDNLNIEDFKLGIFSETNCKRNLTEDIKLDSVEICKAKSESFIV